MAEHNNLNFFCCSQTIRHIKPKSSTFNFYFLSTNFDLSHSFDLVRQNPHCVGKVL